MRPRTPLPACSLPGSSGGRRGGALPVGCRPKWTSVSPFAFLMSCFLARFAARRLVLLRMRWRPRVSLPERLNVLPFKARRTVLRLGPSFRARRRAACRRPWTSMGVQPLARNECARSISAAVKCFPIVGAVGRGDWSEPRRCCGSCVLLISVQPLRRWHSDRPTSKTVPVRDLKMTSRTLQVRHGAATPRPENQCWKSQVRCLHRGNRRLFISRARHSAPPAVPTLNLGARGALPRPGPRRGRLFISHR